MAEQIDLYQAPDRLFRVTLEQTGESKIITAKDGAGAGKISGFPPGTYVVEDITAAAPAGVLELPETKDRGSNSALTAHQREALILWGADLGIRVDLGHACILYGVPTVTVDGLIYHAKRCDPGMRYEVEHWSIAAKAEVGLPATTFAATARVYSGAGIKLAERIGTVAADELTEKSKKDPDKLRYPVVAKKPFEMVENRALWDALGDAFPLGIGAPAVIEVEQ